MHNSDIDFVVLWVDSNDVEWQKKKAAYTPGQHVDISAARYRDWDNLRYWFRAVAKYAPWVRTIHFVTDGQAPVWLNTNNPHLHCVNHGDYMPPDALPTFNSSAIEIGMHRITGLADKFVFFNDDMFLTAPITPDFYFHHGLPVDMAGLTRPCNPKPGKAFGNIMYNDYQILNRHFDRRVVLKQNRTKWLKPSYGKALIRTLVNLNRSTFDGLVIPHLSVPYRRSDLERVWNLYGKELQDTMYHRFREDTDLNHFLFRFWRLCEGDFFPRRSRGRYIALKDQTSAETAAQIIVSRKKPEICINDDWQTGDFEAAKETINRAFDRVLPGKCEYEI